MLHVEVDEEEARLSRLLLEGGDTLRLLGCEAAGRHRVIATRGGQTHSNHDRLLQDPLVTYSPNIRCWPFPNEAF